MITIEQLKEAAEKAGMSKFMFLDPEKGPSETHFVIGRDFLERLHEQLKKEVKPAFVYEGQQGRDLEIDLEGYNFGTKFYAGE